MDGGEPDAKRRRLNGAASVGVEGQVCHITCLIGHSHTRSVALWRRSESACTNLNCFSPMLSLSLGTSAQGHCNLASCADTRCCLQAAESAGATLLGSLAGDGAAARPAAGSAVGGPALSAAVAACEQPTGALKTAAAEPGAGRGTAGVAGAGDAPGQPECNGVAGGAAAETWAAGAFMHWPLAA